MCRSRNRSQNRTTALVESANMNQVAGEMESENNRRCCLVIWRDDRGRRRCKCCCCRVND